MEEFPALRSGATIQYPVERRRQATQIHVEFWGGDRQSYLRKRSGGLVWALKYSGLSEDELASLLEFSQRYEESGEAFLFRDPINGAMHDQCRVAHSSVSAASFGPASCQFEVRIFQTET